MAIQGEIKEYTPDHLLATWGNVLIAVWRRETTMSGVQSAIRCYEEHAYQHPDGVLLLTIVEEGAPLPETAVRRELARLLDRGAGRTKKSAVVFEGSGFRAAAVRSVITGLALFAKVPYPHRVFGKVEDAVHFFEPSSKTSSRMIELAIRAVRERYESNLGKTA
jgi:hypothetical protein